MGERLQFLCSHYSHGRGCQRNAHVADHVHDRVFTAMRRAFDDPASFLDVVAALVRRRRGGYHPADEAALQERRAAVRAALGRFADTEALAQARRPGPARHTEAGDLAVDDLRAHRPHRPGTDCGPTHHLALEVAKQT